MDAILLTVTGISVALAAVMGVLLARMLREDRRRSDARVALLSELAGQPGASSIDEEEALTSGAVIEPQRRLIQPVVAMASARPAFAKAPARQADSPAESERTFIEPEPVATQPLRVLAEPPTEPVELPRRIIEQPRVAAAAEPQPRIKPSRLFSFDDDDLELRPGVAQSVPAAHDLFDETDAPSAWPRRFAVIGGLAAAVVLGFTGWTALNQRQSAPLSPAAEVAGPVVDAPLELLSLRHAQEGGTFSITGLVQNPLSGRDLSRVKATLFVFGPGGSFLTSGRAPLDFTTLGPGEESPFVIRVPVTGEVARYRIGFRGDDDRVLAHVDRRQADAIAQK